MKPASSKRKRLVLFIGHHKVGSTSLQDYLARNAPELSRHGILYPFVDFQGMAFLADQLRKGPVPRAKARVREGLAYLSGGKAALRPTGYHLPINVREPHNALAFRMMNADDPKNMPGYHKRLPSLAQMEHAIRQQLEFSSHHTVIIAAEVLSNFAVVCPDKVERLLALFPNYDVTLMATLRRVDEYVMSWHGQRLKFGHVMPRLSEGALTTYRSSIHFDYRRMLESWLNAVPDARLKIRDYHDVAAAGGSVRDFVEQAELKMPMFLQRERRHNDGIHRGIYELVRQGNQTLERSSAAKFRNTLRDLSKRMTLPKSNSIELLGPDIRQQMAQDFAPIDDWLRDVTGKPDGFFADLDKVLEVKPVPEVDVIPIALEEAKKLWPSKGDAADLKPVLTKLGG